MLRSFAYAAAGARAPARRRRRPTDWEERARERVPRRATSSRRRVAAAARPAGDRAAARGLRAREGGLRAALRAQQPARLGRDPGRRASLRLLDSEHADMTRRRPTSIARQQRRTRTPYPRRAPGRTAAVRVRAFRPGGADGRAWSTADGTHVDARARRTRRGVFEGELEGRRAAARATSSRSTTATAARSRSTTRTASCRRSASSTCTCSARAATRSCGSGSARTCASSTASPAPRSPSGRRPRGRSRSSATSTPGTGACTRCARSARRGIWELFLPGVGAGRALQVRDPRAGRRASA